MNQENIDLFVNTFREMYEKRDTEKVENILNFFSEEVYIIGTSLGELYKGKKELRELLSSDLQYWVNVHIQPLYKIEQINEYQIITLSAFACFQFKVNNRWFNSYVEFMKRIEQGKGSNYYKAVKMMWAIDHVLAQRDKVKLTDNKDLRIQLIIKNNLIELISYEMILEKNHIHCIENEEEEMSILYKEDINKINNCSDNLYLLLKETTIDDLYVKELYIEQRESIFRGIGKLINNNSLEDELKKDFSVLDRENLLSNEKLYDLRKSIGETLRLYSLGNVQEIMVRIYGIICNDKIIYMKHTYPFYWILAQ